MSDQGERGMRWTDMSESEPRDGSGQDPQVGGGPQMAFPEPKVPEGLVPPPAGRAEPAEAPEAPGFPDSADSGKGSDSHDVWGRVEEPRAGDVRVAPASEEESPQWEGDLFDEDSAEGPGDERYTPAVPTGAGEPGRPGKPSSGNWQMPAWMADEESTDAKLGGSSGSSRDVLDDGGGRSRLVLFGGVGLLVVALVAAGAVYLLKNGGGEPAESGGNAGRTSADRPGEPQAELPPDKRLTAFAGRPSRVAGQVPDAHSGLSYPRMAAPWKVPTKKNKLGISGWSGQQILVTENTGGQLWYGQLLTGTLHPSMQAAYQGPGSVKNAAAVVAANYEAQYYAFPHKTVPLASQALNVGGRPGWMIASYLTYQRDGVKATGEVVATAVIDNGRKTPAVVFASMPNTHKKMWPDLNTFFSRLKIAS